MENKSKRDKFNFTDLLKKSKKWFIQPLTAKDSYGPQMLILIFWSAKLKFVILMKNIYKPFKIPKFLIETN